MKDDLMPLLWERASQSPAAKNAERFLQKMKSFVHMPANLRELRRIERFATDTALTQLVADVLRNEYPVWLQEQAYDQVHYWYCVGLLCFQPEDKPAAQLFEIIEEMIHHSFEDIHLVRKMLDYFPAVAALDRHRERVAAFYQSIAPKVESLQWIQQVGLPVPSKDWQISFELSTDGERRFDFDLTPEEKDSRLEIVVTVNSVARGNAHSWWLNLYNTNKTVQAQWSQPTDKSIRVKDMEYALPVQPSLLNFADTLARIESIVNTRFVRKPVKVYFSSGLKGKEAIARWMQSL